MSTYSPRRTLNPGNSQGKGGRGGYNDPKTECLASHQINQSKEQAYTISGYDLTMHVMKEKQYAGMSPMERFLYEGGSSLQRRATRMVPKGLL